MEDLPDHRILLPKPLHPIATLDEQMLLSYEKTEQQSTMLIESIRRVREWLNIVFSKKELHMIQYNCSLAHHSAEKKWDVPVGGKGFMAERTPGEWNRIEMDGLEFEREDNGRMHEDVLKLGEFFRVQLLVIVRNAYHGAFNLKQPVSTTLQTYKDILLGTTSIGNATHAKLSVIMAAFADSVQMPGPKV